MAAAGGARRDRCRAGAERRGARAARLAPHRRRPRRPRPGRWRGCTTSASAVDDRRHRQRRGRRAGTRPSAAPVMTRLAHRHRAHRWPLRRQPRGARRARGDRDARAARRRRPRARSPSAFFTDEEGARFAPDMLGSLVFVGGLPLEEALDVAAVDDGSRLGDELEPDRLRRSHAVPGAPVPHALRRAAHRAGAGARGRGHRPSGPSPGCRASRGRGAPSPASRPTPAPRRCAMRHDPGYVAAAIVTVLVRAWPRELGGAPGRHRRAARARPQPGQRGAGAGDASPSTCATPTRRSLQQRRATPCASSRELAQPPRASTIDDALPRPLRAGRVRPRDDRPRRGAPPSASVTASGACRRGAGHDAQMLRPGLPDVDDLRAERQRPSHNPAEHTAPRRRRPPAPTCCCRCCSTAGG